MFSKLKEKVVLFFGAVLTVIFNPVALILFFLFFFSFIVNFKNSSSEHYQALFALFGLNAALGALCLTIAPLCDENRKRMYLQTGEKLLYSLVFFMFTLGCKYAFCLSANLTSAWIFYIFYAVQGIGFCFVGLYLTFTAMKKIFDNFGDVYSGHDKSLLS